MTNETIVLHEADQSIMKALPSDKVRKTAMYIMAADLGIPASFVDNPATALMATTAIMQALNLRLTYGAIPGVHIHAVPRKSKVTDANGREQWVDSYQIQDGEKLYKDSMSRHAGERGFIWAFADNRMTREEIVAEAKSRGCTEIIPDNAVGIWSAVKTSDHAALGVDPMPVAGVWFGFVKQGRRWFADNLPSGTSPQDVAMRRAHKRAIMVSEYPLRPLNDSPDVRAHEFVGEMLSRVEDHDKGSAMFVDGKIDDDMLDVGSWAEVDDEPEAKAAIIAGWGEPADAMAWANDVYNTPSDADIAFRELVADEFGGTLTKRNAAEVYAAWYDEVKTVESAAAAFA